jgi:lysophospholipase L1-like esterase
MVMQTLGARSPILVCAGAGGDSVEKLTSRFAKDVEFFAPQWVVISSGVNDASAAVTPETFAQSLRTLIERTTRSGARVMLMTPILIVAKTDSSVAEREKTAAISVLLDRYAEKIAALGAELNLPVAPVRLRMQEAASNHAIATLLAADGIHPNKWGQALIARAFLDALGDATPLAEKFRYRAYPGLIEKWRVVTADGEVDYTVPEPANDPAEDTEEWKAQTRLNGFATRLEEQFGRGRRRVKGVLPASAGETVWLQLGGGIKSLSLNGQPLPLRTDWAGYHAGYQRLPVELHAGDNQLEAEIEGMFLILATPEKVWEGALRGAAGVADSRTDK